MKSNRVITLLPTPRFYRFHLIYYVIVGWVNLGPEFCLSGIIKYHLGGRLLGLYAAWRHYWGLRKLSPPLLHVCKDKKKRLNKSWYDFARQRLLGVASFGLGGGTERSLGLNMRPFRHTKALNRPNYTKANLSRTSRVKCLTSGVTPFMIGGHNRLQCCSVSN